MSLLHRRMMMEKEVDEGMVNRWELIADVTLSETAQSISITEDINGKAFRLKGVEIFMISMPGTKSNAGDISACMTKSRTSSTKIGTCAESTDEKKYCYGLWEKTGLGVVNKKALWSINGSTNINGMTTSLTAQQGFNDNGPDCPEICEGIWIGSHYQDVLTPGTRIRIFGVRE